MADNERKRLIWSIKKKLHLLTAEGAYEVATHIQPVAGLDSSKLSKDDEESCVEFISAYMNSQSLLEEEDEGMATLLFLEDTVGAIITNCDKGTVLSKANIEAPAATLSPARSPDTGNENQHESDQLNANVSDIQGLLISLDEIQNRLRQYNVNMSGTALHASNTHTPL